MRREIRTRADRAAQASFFGSAVPVRCDADLVPRSAALTRCGARLPTHLTNQRPKVRRAWASGDRKTFFITCNLLPVRTLPTEVDFQALASAVVRVRGRQGFLFTGYVFMPDHWHALIIPREDDTLIVVHSQTRHLLACLTSWTPSRSRRLAPRSYEC